jgi:Right handed beta helix region
MLSRSFIHLGAACTGWRIRPMLRAMISLRLVALLCVAARLSAAEYYVAVNGSDANAGSLAAPFASVQRAQKVAQPGDTVFVRGGTYAMTEAQIAQSRRIWAYVIALDKSGSVGKPINYWAYRDEQPVFDFTNVKPAGRRVTAFLITGSWLHLKGLTVTGVQVTMTGHTQSICFDNQGSSNIYERLSMHDGQAIGLWLGKGSDNLVLNCDAYRNYDYTSENKRGGNVDGFGFHAPTGSTGNVFRGCRAWFNSDDGFDFIGAGASVTVENCWAFYNGYTPEFGKLADGNGFKAGGYGISPGADIPDPIPRHVIRGCVAVRNKAAGFYANHHHGGNDWLNNTAFFNGTNFNMLCRIATGDVPGFGHRMKNNLGFKGRAEVSNLDAAACDVSGNYFNLPVKVEEKDFAGLDVAELVKPRQANGDLPEMAFLHLAKGSGLIDKGVDVGLPFAGTAPDLGAFEFGAAKK